MARIPTDSNLMSPMGDIETAVAIGAIPGWRTFRKFGMNENVDTGSQEVWAAGGTRVLPSTAAVASVVSSSIDDTAGGDGARTINVNGLDENWDEVTVAVTLNGQTPVETTQTFIRINRTWCTTAGVDEVNAGNIQTSVGGDLQSYIEATEGQCHCCNYSVPAGHTLLIDYYTNTTGRQANTTDVHFLGQIKLFDDNPVWRSISDVYNFQTQYINAKVAEVLPEKTDVRVLAVSNANNNVVSATFGGFLIANNSQGNFI